MCCAARLVPIAGPSETDRPRSQQFQLHHGWAARARLGDVRAADVLRGEARADRGRQAVARALRHVVAAALAAAVARPRHITVAERRVRRRVKYQPPARQNRGVEPPLCWHNHFNSKTPIQPAAYNQYMF